MSSCHCGCGRQTAAGQAYAQPACRDRIDRGLSRARELAQLWDRPDTVMDALKLSRLQRKVLVVLRHAPATGDELSQPEVGGRRAAARVAELRDLGFPIDSQPIRRGLWRYTLGSEPPVQTRVEKAPVQPEAGLSSGGRDEPSPAPPRLASVPTPSDPQCAIFDWDDEAA